MMYEVSNNLGAYPSAVNKHASHLDVLGSEGERK